MGTGGVGELGELERRVDERVAGQLADAGEPVGVRIVGAEVTDVPGRRGGVPIERPLLVALGGALASAPAQAGPPKKKPLNIISIVTDDQGRWAVGA